MAVELAIAALCAVGVWWLEGPDLRGSGDADLAFACPADADQAVSTADADSIPLGATSVLLCRGPGQDFQEPADALTTNIRELVDLVNEQPRRPRPDACPDDFGFGYRLVFSYPDGTAMDMTGELYGCPHMNVGDEVKQNPRRVWEFFREALRDQRAATPPPPSDGQPACGDRGSREHSPIGTSAEMRRAVMCPFLFRDPDRGGSAAFTEQDLAVLLADQATADHTRDGFDDSGCTAELREFDIVGITAWGDHVSMDGICGVLHDEEGYWRPGPEALAVIDRLFDEADLR